MSAIVPSYSSARPGIDETNANLCDLAKDLDKFPPEHRSQVMIDRLRQQKLRAMISLAKAQHYLAETDVMIADYNLQAVAEEFEHLKKERFNNIADISQISGRKDEKLVSSTACPTSSGNPNDFYCTQLLPAVGHSKSKEKDITPKISTQLEEPHRSKSKTDAYTPTPKNLQPMNEIGSKQTSKEIKDSSKTCEPTTSKTYKESSSKTKGAATSKPYEASSSNTKEDTTSKTYEASSSKTKEATTSKTYEASSFKTKEATTSKTYAPSSSKTKEATTSKTYEASSSKTKEATTSKTHEASSSKSKEAATSKTYEPSSSKTKEAASLADTDVLAPGLKSKKRKRTKSKSKECKRHKSSHKHATSSHAPTESTLVPAASSNVHTASLGPVASSHAPAASSNMNTALLRSAASSHVHTVFSRPPASPTHAPAAPLLVPAAPALVPTVSSHVQALLSHVPNCDCVKSNPIKEKTLLNTSISPIKKIVSAKGVQTDKKAFKNHTVQTNEVETQTKAVQTDNVIILHVGSQTIRENSPDIDDEETLLLDTLPAPHSHSTAITLAKALQQIKSQKTSVLERLCPTEPHVSQVLSQNDVLQKIELIMEDEAETADECPVVVKMERRDGDIPNTSTEVLVNNLYKDIVKGNDEETNKGTKTKGKVTKRALWKILDKC